MKKIIIFAFLCATTLIIVLMFFYNKECQNINNINADMFFVKSIAGNTNFDVLLTNNADNVNVEQNNVIYPSTNIIESSIVWPAHYYDMKKWREDIESFYKGEISSMPEKRIITNQNKVDEYIEMTRKYAESRSKNELKPTVYLYGKTIIVAYLIIYPPPPEGYAFFGTRYIVYTIDSETKTPISESIW